MRFDPVAGISFAALTLWANLAVAPGSCVASGGLLGFEVLERLGYTAQSGAGPRRYAGTEIGPFKWLNVLLGDLQTALSGTHHAFKFAKYARRYLAEVQYRFTDALTWLQLLQWCCDWRSRGTDEAVSEMDDDAGEV